MTTKRRSAPVALVFLALLLTSYLGFKAGDALTAYLFPPVSDEQRVEAEMRGVAKVGAMKDDDDEDLEIPDDVVAKKQKTTTEIASVKKELRDALVVFFERHNPGKLATVDAAVDRYYADTKELNAILKKKYGVDLTSVVTTTTSPPPATITTTTRHDNKSQTAKRRRPLVNDGGTSGVTKEVVDILTPLITSFSERNKCLMRQETECLESAISEAAASESSSSSHERGAHDEEEEEGEEELSISNDKGNAIYAPLKVICLGMPGTGCRESLAPLFASRFRIPKEDDVTFRLSPALLYSIPRGLESATALPSTIPDFGVFGDVDAVFGSPAAMLHFEEILSVYSNAKIVVATRDVDSWLNSNTLLSLLASAVKDLDACAPSALTKVRAASTGDEGETNRVNPPMTKCQINALSHIAVLRALFAQEVLESPVFLAPHAHTRFQRRRRRWGHIEINWTMARMRFLEFYARIDEFLARKKHLVMKIDLYSSRLGDERERLETLRRLSEFLGGGDFSSDKSTHLASYLPSLDPRRTLTSTNRILLGDVGTSRMKLLVTGLPGSTSLASAIRRVLQGDSVSFDSKSSSPRKKSSVTGQALSTRVLVIPSLKRLLDPNYDVARCLESRSGAWVISTTSPSTKEDDDVERVACIALETLSRVVRGGTMGRQSTPQEAQSLMDDFLRRVWTEFDVAIESEGLVASALMTAFSKEVVPATRVLLSKVENVERWIARNVKCLHGAGASASLSSESDSTSSSHAYSPPQSKWERFSSLLFGVKSSASTTSSSVGHISDAYTESCPACFAMMGGDTHPHLWRRRAIDFQRALDRFVPGSRLSVVLDESSKQEDETRWRIVCDALREARVGLARVEAECTPKLLNSPFPKRARQTGGGYVPDESVDDLC